MPQEPDIEAVVKELKLTQTQREAIVSGLAWSGHTRNALIRAGIAVVRYRGFRNFYYETIRYPLALTPSASASPPISRSRSMQGDIDTLIPRIEQATAEQVRELPTAPE